MPSDPSAFLSDATERPEPKRDQWGRYVLPHPETGVEQGWTRATTVAKALSDQHAIAKWRERMVALGMARRADLVAAVAACDAADKAKLNRLTDDAAEAAASSSGSNYGTALHTFTERLDRGEPHEAPEELVADLVAYNDALNEADVMILPHYMERILVVPRFGIAGTTDRIVEVGGKLYIADLKTGKSLDFGGMDIACQLAIYANATHMFAPGADGSPDYEDMPDVDRERAIVFHLPVGSGECSLHWVDIATGWRMVEAAVEVREWRKRKDLIVPFSKPEPTVETVEPVDQWDHCGPECEDDHADVIPPDAVALVERIKACGANEAARRKLLLSWTEGDPTRPPWTNEEAGRIARAVELAEAEAGLPFPAEEPNYEDAWTTPEPTDGTDADHGPGWTTDDGGPATTEDERTAVTTRLSLLSKAQKERGAQWTRDAGILGRSFNDLAVPRQLAIARAAVACLEHLFDEDDSRTRLALSIVLNPTPVSAKWWTGAVLGALSAAQAVRLETLANDFGDGKPSAVQELAATAASNG